MGGGRDGAGAEPSGWRPGDRPDSAPSRAATAVLETINWRHREGRARLAPFLLVLPAHRLARRILRLEPRLRWRHDALGTIAFVAWWGAMEGWC